ncbi:MAG: sugar phosphate isomerase/epimerase [Candidatus Solibacter usitatus]|nr:sugar phosphate isomerase/epimerase [Candidatus Solibacter usitatus]
MTGNQKFEACLHSVSYAGVWPGQARLTLESFLDKAAELGYGSVILMAKRPHLSLLDYGRERRLRLREEMAARGLRCAVIAGYNNFSGDAEHPEIPQREIQLQHIGGLCRAARDLGAPVVRVFTAYEHPSWPAHTLAGTLREAAAMAADCGVTLGVQNHHDWASHYLTLRDLLEEVDHPNCRACFDAWTPALQGDDLAEAARVMAQWTVHTTAADYQRRPRFRYNPAQVNFEARTAAVQAVSMGRGMIDYRTFLRVLGEGGYRGVVAYEMCSPLLGGGSEENLDRKAREFREWLTA